MKENVFVYLLDGTVQKMYVECPEVGVCNGGSEVGIFNHRGYQTAIDDYEEWYEDIAFYWTTDVLAIYADKKCVWHNSLYIKDNSVSVERVLSAVLPTVVQEEEEEELEVFDLPF